ncbi:MAG: hypothetical protein HON70_08515, partial [Lentisphaerae bacterium]|nr:hypothetical protein [Lentisphaerota bacterium]
PATLPAIMGTLWRTRKNDSAILAVNTDDHPHRLMAEVDLSRQLPDTKAPHGWLISRRTPEGEAPFMWSADGNVLLDQTLDPGEILALIAKPSTSPSLSKPVTQAGTRVANGSTVPRLRQAAEQFLFDARCRRASLKTEIPRHPIRSPDGEPVDLTVQLQNSGDTPQVVRLTWPDDHEQKVTVPVGGATSHTHTFWPATGVDHWAETIGIELADIAPGETSQLPVRGYRVPAVSVALGTPPDVHGGESFMLPLEIRNNSRSTRNIVLQLDAPGTWQIEPTRQITFNGLKPNTRRDVLLKCRVPDTSAASVARIDARILEQAGSTSVNVLKSRPRTTAKHATALPKIDGILQDWPAEPALTLDPAQPDCVKISEGYKGAADCSARLRFAWSKTHLFVAAEVRDDVHHQEEKEFQIWRGDCIQLAFRQGPPNPKTGYDGTEFEVGLTQGPDGKAVLFQWAPGARALTDGQLAVVQAKGTTVYEAAIPWTALGVTNVRPGSRTSWSMTINDNDGEGFRGWLEWTPGVCGAKDSSAFGWMLFQK